MDGATFIGSGTNYLIDSPPIAISGIARNVTFSRTQATLGQSAYNIVVDDADVEEGTLITSLVISSGGSVETLGQISDAIIKASGTLNAGGRATDLSVSGTLNVDGGGFVSDALVDGLLTVDGGASAAYRYQYKESGNATASGLTISGALRVGGSQSGTGFAEDVNLLNGSYIDVTSGGVVSGVNLHSNESINLELGGVVTDATIQAGTTISLVFSATSAYFSAGNLIVDSGSHQLEVIGISGSTAGLSASIIQDFDYNSDLIITSSGASSQIDANPIIQSVAAFTRASRTLNISVASASASVDWAVFGLVVAKAERLA